MRKRITTSSILLKGQYQPWIGTVLGVLAVTVLEYAGLLHTFRSVIEKATQPLRQFGVHVVMVSRKPWDMTRVAVKKYTYVLDLEMRYAESLAKLSELEKLRQENRELRSLLESSASQSGALRAKHFASILSYAQPTVNLGSQDGLQGGELIFVAGTCVGKIKSVSQYQAEVSLLNNLSEEEAILARTETGVSGVITGNSSELLLQEVPIEASVQVGQRVETMGQLNVPPGLLLGRVKRVIRQEGAPTQTAVIDQGVSFFSVTIVEVAL